MNKKIIKQGIIVTLLIMLCGVGAALSLKAAIGVGAYDAMAMSFSNITKVPVGTIGMIFNCSCVVGEFLLLRKNFKFQHLLQIPLSIFLGFIVNFVLYNILGDIVITNYFVNLGLFIFATILLSAVVGVIMEINLVTFALEGFCKVIAEKRGWEFSTVRQAADIISIIISVGLTLIFQVPWAVREGTIIGAIIFGPLMGMFMKLFRTQLRKSNLIVAEAE